MTGISVSGALPAGDGNGLAAIFDRLTDESDTSKFVAIAILDCKNYKYDKDTKEKIPVVRIRRIEVITRTDDVVIAERLLRRALDQRTGRQALPYDVEEAVEGVFLAAEPDDNPDDGKPPGGHNPGDGKP